VHAVACILLGVVNFITWMCPNCDKAACELRWSKYPPPWSIAPAVGKCGAAHELPFLQFGGNHASRKCLPSICQSPKEGLSTPALILEERSSRTFARLPCRCCTREKTFSNFYHTWFTSEKGKVHEQGTGQSPPSFPSIWTCINLAAVTTQQAQRCNDDPGFFCQPRH